MSDEAEESKATEESPHTTPDDTGRWRKLGFTLSVLFVAWLIFTYVAPTLTLDEGPHYDAGDAKQIQKLLGRVDSLEQELATLRSGQSSSEDNGQIAALQEELQQLREQSRQPVKDKRVGKLEEQISRQQDMIAALQDSLQQVRAQTGVHMASLTAFNQLREAVRRGEPFAYELKQLKSLSKGRRDIHDSLALLSQSAAVGVPTAEVLINQFERAVPRALSPDTEPDSFMGNLSSLVSIRKTGTPEGDDNQAIIARAETALKEGRIKASLQLLKPLPENAAKAFDKWEVSARRAIESQTALDRLEVAFAQTQQTAAAPPPVPMQYPQRRFHKKKPGGLPPVPMSIRIPPEDVPELKIMHDETQPVSPPAHD